jgi:hypothetical protein
MLLGIITERCVAPTDGSEVHDARSATLRGPTWYGGTQSWEEMMNPFSATSSTGGIDPG